MDDAEVLTCTRILTIFEQSASLGSGIGVVIPGMWQEVLCGQAVKHKGMRKKIQKFIKKNKIRSHQSAPVLLDICFVHKYYSSIRIKYQFVL